MDDLQNVCPDKNCGLQIEPRQHIISCSECKLTYHRTCQMKVSPTVFANLKKTNSWKCSSCKISNQNISTTSVQGSSAPIVQINEKTCCVCNTILLFNQICGKCILEPYDVLVDKIPSEFLQCLVNYVKDLNLSLSTLNINWPVKFIRGTKVLHINVNGIKSSLPELEIFLKHYKLEVLVITETKLSKEDADSCIAIDNYDLLRFDRDTRQGGGTI